MASDRQLIKELQDAKKYEDLLNSDYRKLSLKEVIPRQQEEVITFEKDSELQQNLTRNNLKSVFRNSPGLINEIVQYITNVDGDLINFNKYFNTFKNAISGIKINNITEFENVWQQFKIQQLGQQLNPTPPTTVIFGTNDIKQLEKMTTEEIDDLFRAYVEKATGKNIEEVESIQYPLLNGKLSSSLKLINKEKGNIIKFSPEPKDTTIKGDVLARENNAKIRYIYKVSNPDLIIKNLKVKWVRGKGVGTTTGERVGTTTGKEVVGEGVQRTTGTGLSSIMALKKKLVHSKYI
mgnify:CR=1 FL=1